MDDGQLKDAWMQRQEPGGTASSAVLNTAAAPSASPPPQSAFDIRSFSLFPSTLSDSPHHHSPSHSIVTLSEGAPRDVPPSPYLSESPTLAPQTHAHLGLDHILSNDRLIVNVWASNLQEELAKIVAIVDDYPYIAMDTEFPGVVARPTAKNSSNSSAYETLKCNVDILKIIQLGLCFCDAKGNIHPGTCTWQFNFSFSLNSDTYAQDSIDLLSKSGIDFSAHEKNGISTADFGEWLMTSGIVLNEDVKWISFHSGFDFGYLLKILTCAPLPSKEDEFFALLQLYFPVIYDIKFLMDSCQNLHGGLSKIAETLNVIRIGPQHQAGSDSLLTAATFFKLRMTHFNADTNAMWVETQQNRNAVKREMKLSAVPLSAAASASLAATTPSYSVIVNSDPLSAFDAKYLGMLFGLNNDYTESWKRRVEKEKEKRHKKEHAIAQGHAVSSDDDEEEVSVQPTDKPLGNQSFVPGVHHSSSSGSYGGPSTPQKSASSGAYSSSPAQHYNEHHSASKAGNNTKAHMHRSRYSHDYS